MKYARAKAFASSRLQAVTSQNCLHSSNDDSFTLSNLTEPDSVSRCKQEELTCGLSKQSFKGSRGANKTKNALWFAADARTEHGRGPSGGGFVDVKFLHEVIRKRRNIFLLRHDEDMTLICLLSLDKSTEGPVVTVQRRKHLYWWHLLPLYHHYNPISLGVRTLRCPFSLLFFPEVILQSSEQISAELLQITRGLAAKRLVMAIREQKNLNGATDPPSILQEMTLTFLIVCGLWDLHSCSLWIYFLSELLL